MSSNRTAQLKTTDIGGSDYTLVVTRVKYLAECFDYSIDTNAEYIEALDAWKVKAVLTIYENEKARTYSGSACEVINSSEINSTSALENAETSAVGRACALAGIGLTENIASADEVSGAKEKIKSVNNIKRNEKAKSAEEKALEKLNGNKS